jgi:hypothetical protein
MDVFTFLSVTAAAAALRATSANVSQALCSSAIALSMAPLAFSPSSAAVISLPAPSICLLSRLVGNDGSVGFVGLEVSRERKASRKGK